MIASIIETSVRNRVALLAFVGVLLGLGLLVVERLTIDAIPDLSDVQVIVLAEHPGQSPEVVEDQLTYPLTTAMLAVPRAQAVRGYSYFGFSLVYVIFEDGTDPYWARSRTSESLADLQGQLPTGVSVELGPDATGVGWVYQYVLHDFGPYAEVLRRALDQDGDDRADPSEVAATMVDGPWDRARLVDCFSSHPELDPATAADFTLDDFDASGDGRLSPPELQRAANFAGVALDELRSVQDWFLRYELSALPGVAEVASVGGFVRQYQVEVDPDRLEAFDIPLSKVRTAVRQANDAVGGRLIELAETEYLVQGSSYVKSVQDLEQAVLLTDPETHVPVLLRDVADVHWGPELRRGVTDWNGMGEAPAGIVVMRFGENARDVIRRVKERLDELSASLPIGVRVVPAYDRSTLIDRAVDTVGRRLVEEMVIVALVCLVFLLHVRSAFVAAIAVPLGILAALVLMALLGINANIMSLGGIAIAVGVMVDASVVMVENLHKHLDRDPTLPREKAVIAAATEVGPAVFYSLVVITLSFLPVFALEAQEGRLFRPLAYTKTFAMVASSLLAITVVPALMVVFVRGRIRSEERNPVSRFALAVYRPMVETALRWPRLTVFGALVVVGLSLVPAADLGSEFMPPLDEGDILYMPTTLPGISITKAKQLLQQTDRIIGRFPEVKHVFGKVGRAETATDPAPLSMIETTIVLYQDRSRWRDGMTTRRLIRELDAAVQIPGLTNAWTMPIRARIDMLATGIKTPVGLKLLGTDLDSLTEVGRRIEAVLETVPGTQSVYSERSTGGKFVEIDVRRREIARYGLSVAEVHDVIQSAIGGRNVTFAVEGLARYPINVRYSPELRDDLPALERVLVPTEMGHGVPLGQLADLRVRQGPASVKSENARRSSWIYVDLSAEDLGGYVRRAKAAVAEKVDLPPGVSVQWSGQYEYLERATRRLTVLVPLTVLIVVMLLYVLFRRVSDTLIVMLSLPFSLVGGVWLMAALGYNLSVASVIGFIAVAGLAAETGVVMIVYLNQALARREAEGAVDSEALLAAIREGAVERLRPKLMTVATTLLGLVPVMTLGGTGSQVLRRIAAPMVGGVLSSAVLTLLVIPAVFLLVRRSSA
jgi:Cu(I)/Ag(I) efflux system membrane protein CusA/SilA